MATEQRGVKRAFVEASPPKRNMVLNLNDGKMRIEMTTGTDIGSLPTNEDRFRFGKARSRFDPNAVPIHLFGVFDGHGGCSAVNFVRDHLFEKIAKDLKLRESKDMPSLLRNAFVSIQEDMKRSELEKWPTHPISGYLSTSGTTAAVVAITDDKMWVAHVGDSCVIVSWKEGITWRVERLTKDHKCSDADEAKSLAERGGEIIGNRVARTSVSTSTGQAKTRGFLTMTRALGNFWSFCTKTGKYIVSPEPDICCRELDKECLIVICSDGITHELTDLEILEKFLQLDMAQRRSIERAAKSGNGDGHRPEYFVADEIIEMAKDNCATRKRKADNMTAITLRVTV